MFEKQLFNYFFFPSSRLFFLLPRSSSSPLHEFAFAAHHSDKQHNYCSRLKEKSNAYFETQSAGSGIFLEPPVESELHEN